MTDKENAQKEWEAVRQWVLDEEDRVIRRLKEEGRYAGGLDGNQEEFAYIYEARDKQIKAIKEKYGI